MYSVDLKTYQFCTLKKYVKRNPTRCIQWTKKPMVSLPAQQHVITHIEPGVLSGMGKLVWLYLHNNMLTRLLPTVFGELKSLEVLFLSHNPLVSRFISNLTCLNWLALSNISLTFLMYQQKFFKLCGAHLDLSGNNLQELGFYPFGRFAIVNNILSILVKCKQKKQVNKVQLSLITNLSISDLLMGFYLIILLSADLYCTDYFPSHSELWQNSTLCKIAGALSVLLGIFLSP